MTGPIAAIGFLLVILLGVTAFMIYRTDNAPRSYPQPAGSIYEQTVTDLGDPLTPWDLPLFVWPT